MSSPSSSTVLVPTPRVTEAHVRITALFATLSWAQVLLRAAERESGPVSSLSLAAAGLAAQLVFSGIEGACTAVAWRALGARVGVTPLATRVLAASVVEAFAVAILTQQVSLPESLAATLCGPRAWPGWVPDSGSARAWAATGVLTLMRVGLSAHAQARLVGRSFPRALAVVGSLYLTARLVLWWTSDLMLGHSFQP